jgi:hypothetical protein
MTGTLVTEIAVLMLMNVPMVQINVDQ